MPILFHNPPEGDRRDVVPSAQNLRFGGLCPDLTQGQKNSHHVKKRKWRETHNPSCAPWFFRAKCSIFLMLGKTDGRSIPGEMARFRHFLKSLAAWSSALVVPRSRWFRFILSLVRVRYWFWTFRLSVVSRA